METKKNPKFDLESRRSTFFFFGLVISLVLVFFAFKNGEEVKAIEIPNMDKGYDITDIYTPVTKDYEEVKVVPPPVLKLFDHINIADNFSSLPEPDFYFDEPGDPFPPPPPFTEKANDNADAPLLFAQQMPEFPGGTASLNRWLSRNINYPEAAQNLGLSGRIYLNFIVDRDGSISNIRVTRGVDDLLDQEAIRVIGAMPKWKPGMQNGVPVKVSFNIYVTFKLEDNHK